MFKQYVVTMETMQYACIPKPLASLRSEERKVPNAPSAKWCHNLSKDESDNVQLPLPTL